MAIEVNDKIGVRVNNVGTLRLQGSHDTNDEADVTLIAFLASERTVHSTGANDAIN